MLYLHLFNPLHKPIATLSKFQKTCKGEKNIHVLQHFGNYLYSCTLGIAGFNRKVKSSIFKDFHYCVVAIIERKGNEQSIKEKKCV